jgi:hypothetical protein
VAYYIKNPNPDEKKLLDENNWNTCVDLGEGLTHNDRVKNIIAYEEGVVPEDVSELYETINRWINRKTQYPAYLIDPDQGSWAASVWVTISSVWTHVQEEYDELWYAGVDHDCLSTMEAIYAKRFLDKGDIDSAKEHLQNCFLHNKISNMYFGAAAEIFDANIKRAEEMVKSTLKLIEVGVALLNPMAGKFASYMFMAPNYIADTDLVGVEQAQKNAVRDLVFKVIFSEYKYPELGDRTFENYLNNRIGKITFPYLQKIFENNEAVQFYLSKALKEAASEGMEWLYDKADSLSEKIVDELSKRFEEYTYKKFSPIELRVLNLQGEITGQINGSVRHDISRSFYRNGTITILFPSGSYICEVAGKEEGTYGLEISSVEAWNVTTFTATEIPTSTNVIHQYTIDWDALSQGEEGVTVQVDSDGDGVFEHTFTSDSELNYDEFMLQTATTIDIDPDVLNLKSKGKWITAYVEFPEGYNVSDIDVSSILLNGTIPVDLNAPTAIGDYDGDGVPDLMVKFNRTAVCEFILSKGIKLGNVTLTVSGKLRDGVEFEGCDTIRVRMPGDINMDGKVDTKDISIICKAFGSFPNHPRWNPIADENEDNKIDMFDIALTCKNFGKTYK